MPIFFALSILRLAIFFCCSAFCLVMAAGFCSLSGRAVGSQSSVMSHFALHSISSG